VQGSAGVAGSAEWRRLVQGVVQGLSRVVQGDAEWCRMVQGGTGQRREVQG
jgi:hypothetical protein